MSDFAVVIPHYNDHVRLQRCLEALVPQNGAGVAEVVVVDNRSDLDPRPMVQAFENVTCVIQPEKGAAAARNMGVDVTRAPWLFFLDADCVPGPDWLAQAARLARGHDGLDGEDKGQVIGGRVDVFDETPPPRSGAEAFETVFAFDQRQYIAAKGFSVTANLLCPRAVFEAVGPFHGDVSEDVDWCRRATSCGFALVYEDDLRVSHPTRSDWAMLRRKWLRMTVEGFGLARARPGGRLMWAVRALAMPASIAVHAVRVMRHPALNGAERWRALGTLARLRLQRMAWMLGQAVGRAPR